MEENKFYDNGLRFECQRCSGCCRHEPGYVFLSKNDLEMLCSELDMPENEFLQEFRRTIDLGGINRISLLEKKNFDCIVWSEDGCRVYNARPVQCRTFPFWINYLEDEEAWLSLSKDCPGIGKGDIVSKEETEKRILARQEERMLTV